MALTQRLQIRQSQALVMTPQLMQAIKLLQLSNLDLVAYVEAELERNPLLEPSNADGEAAPAEANSAAAPDQPAGGETWNDSEPASAATQERAEDRIDDTSVEDTVPGRARTSDMPAGYSEWAGVVSGGRDDGEF